MNNRHRCTTTTTYHWNRTTIGTKFDTIQQCCCYCCFYIHHKPWRDKWKHNLSLVVSNSTFIISVLAIVLLLFSTSVQCYSIPSSSISSSSSGSTKNWNSPRGNTIDSLSYGNIEQYQPRHVSMDISIDFTSQSIYGSVTHIITSLTNATVMDRNNNYKMLYMDVKNGLIVQKVQIFISSAIDYNTFITTNATTSIIAESKSSTSSSKSTFNVTTERIESCIYKSGEWIDVIYNISTPNIDIGNSLDIQIPSCTTRIGQSFLLKIYYYTTKESTAIYWNSRSTSTSSTTTTQQPEHFVYTICQYTNCRDFVPIMDTPSSKITYDALVTVLDGHNVYMTANKTSIRTIINETHVQYTFVSKVPISSYLINLVAGTSTSSILQEQIIDNRTMIVGPKSTIGPISTICQPMIPKLMYLMEQYTQKRYSWGSFILIIMPESFEHLYIAAGPILSLLHPSIFLQSIYDNNNNDPSSSSSSSSVTIPSTILQLLAHSYFGHDVTCSNWNHLWLQNGISTFVQRTVLSTYMNNTDYSTYQYYLGSIELNNNIQFLEYINQSSYTALYPNITTTSKSDTVLYDTSNNVIPSEKGAQFLYRIEELYNQYGSTNNNNITEGLLMQILIQQYLSTFSRQSITEQDFNKLFYEFTFYQLHDAALAALILYSTSWNKWINQVGIPPITINYLSKLNIKPNILVNDYVSTIVAAVTGADTNTTPGTTISTQSSETLSDYKNRYDNLLPIQQLRFIIAIADVIEDGKLVVLNGTSTTIKYDLLQLIDTSLMITKSIVNGDALTEFSYNWFVLCILNGYYVVLEPCHNWLGQQEGPQQQQQPTLTSTSSSSSSLFPIFSSVLDYNYTNSTNRSKEYFIPLVYEALTINDTQCNDVIQWYVQYEQLYDEWNITSSVERKLQFSCPNKFAWSYIRPPTTTLNTTTTTTSSSSSCTKKIIITIITIVITTTSILLWIVIG